MSQLDDLLGGLLGGKGGSGLEDILGQVLPHVVDRVSREGQLPPENELDDLFGQLAGMASR